jgi:hypothetical protein
MVAARAAVRIVVVGVVFSAGLARGAPAQNPPAPAVPPPPAIVSGVFVDAGGHPIPHAVLSVVGESLRVAADSQGRFRLAVPPGPKLLAARALGYRPLMWSVALVSGRETRVQVHLEGLSVVLPAMTVVGERYVPSRLAGFYQRQRIGFGKFLDSADLARHFTNSTADLLQGIPGIQMRRVDPFTVAITFPRCQSVERGLSITMPANILGRDRPISAPPSASPSTVGVYVDGFRVGGSPGEALSNINPADIEAIEIYRGPSELPAEFMSDDCAAIVIWTKY